MVDATDASKMVGRHSGIGRRNLFHVVAGGLVAWNYRSLSQLSAALNAEDLDSVGVGNGPSSSSREDQLALLTAAIFCDIVYHSRNETILPPPSYRLLKTYYDRGTGHYAEAWGEFSSSNQLQSICLAHRGSVYGEAQGELQKTSLSDEIKNIRANIEIFMGVRSKYLEVAQDSLVNILQTYKNCPVLVTGHSLAGAACLSSVLWAIDNGHDRVRGCLINPLVWRKEADMDIAPSKRAAAHGRIALLQGGDDPLECLLGETLLRKLFDDGVIKRLKIPHLPELKEVADDLLAGHFPEAAIVGYMRHGICEDVRDEALSLITHCYTRRPPLISAFLERQRSTGETAFIRRPVSASSLPVVRLALGSSS